MSDTTTTTTETAPPATTTPPTTTTAPSWTEGLGDDLKGFVQSKGFSDPKAVVESYRNLEKLQGVPKERLLQLPESLESEEMKAVWERLGKPKEAKEYKLDVVPEASRAKVQELMHKHNIPRAAAEGLIKEYVAMETEASQSQKETIALKIEADAKNLQKEWGQDFEKNKNIANQAALRFGLDAEKVKALGQAMGFSEALKFLHKLGEGIGEATFEDGDGKGPGTISPERAQSEIKELIKDTDFQRRMSNGDADAKAKWNRLHQFAYMGEHSL